MNQPLGEPTTVVRLVGNDGSEYTLKQGFNILGRSKSTCNIVLTNPSNKVQKTISARHAEINVTISDKGEPVVELRDLESHNGTYVNGTNIKNSTSTESNDGHLQLVKGDKLKFGHDTNTFELKFDEPVTSEHLKVNIAHGANESVPKCSGGNNAELKNKVTLLESQIRDMSGEIRAMTCEHLLARVDSIIVQLHTRFITKAFTKWLRVASSNISDGSRDKPDQSGIQKLQATNRLNVALTNIIRKRLAEAWSIWETLIPTTTIHRPRRPSLPKSSECAQVWEAYYDETHSRPYWYNPQTLESTWDNPYEVLNIEETSSKHDDKARSETPHIEVSSTNDIPLISPQLASTWQNRIARIVHRQQLHKAWNNLRLGFVLFKSRRGRVSRFMNDRFEAMLQTKFRLWVSFVRRNKLYITRVERFTVHRLLKLKRRIFTTWRWFAHRKLSTATRHWNRRNVSDQLTLSQALHTWRSPREGNAGNKQEVETSKVEEVALLAKILVAWKALVQTRKRVVQKHGFNLYNRVHSRMLRFHFTQWKQRLYIVKLQQVRLRSLYQRTSLRVLRSCFEGWSTQSAIGRTTHVRGKQTLANRQWKIKYAVFLEWHSCVQSLKREYSIRETWYHKSKARLLRKVLFEWYRVVHRASSKSYSKHKTLNMEHLEQSQTLQDDFELFIHKQRAMAVKRLVRGLVLKQLKIGWNKWKYVTKAFLDKKNRMKRARNVYVRVLGRRKTSAFETWKTNVHVVITARQTLERIARRTQKKYQQRYFDGWSRMVSRNNTRKQKLKHYAARIATKHVFRAFAAWKQCLQWREQRYVQAKSASRARITRKVRGLFRAWYNVCQQRKQLAIQFGKRLLHRHVFQSFVTWKKFATTQVVKRQKVRIAIGKARHRDLSRVFARWTAYHHEFQHCQELVIGREKQDVVRLKAEKLALRSICRRIEQLILAVPFETWREKYLKSNLVQPEAVTGEEGVNKWYENEQDLKDKLQISQKLVELSLKHQHERETRALEVELSDMKDELENQKSEFVERERNWYKERQSLLATMRKAKAEAASASSIARKKERKKWTKRLILETSKKNVASQQEVQRSNQEQSPESRLEQMSENSSVSSDDSSYSSHSNHFMFQNGDQTMPGMVGDQTLPETDPLTQLSIEDVDHNSLGIGAMSRKVISQQQLINGLRKCLENQENGTNQAQERSEANEISNLQKEVKEQYVQMANELEKQKHKYRTEHQQIVNTFEEAALKDSLLIAQLQRHCRKLHHSIARMANGHDTKKVKEARSLLDIQVIAALKRVADTKAVLLATEKKLDSLAHHEATIQNAKEHVTKLEARVSRLQSENEMLHASGSIQLCAQQRNLIKQLTLSPECFNST